MNPQNVPGQIALQETPPVGENLKHFDDIVHAASPKFWQVEYYVQFFEVTTDLAIHRLKKSFIPSSDSFFEHENPDLYCPIWVSATLVFLIAASGHFAMYLEQHEEWYFNIEKISEAGALVFSLLFIVPSVVYYILSNEGGTVTWLEMVSVYGYSFVVFLPAFVLCIAPFWLIRIVVTGAAATWSAIVYLKNIWTEVEATIPGKKMTVGMIGAAGHALIFVAANYHFFRA